MTSVFQNPNAPSPLRSWQTELPVFNDDQDALNHGYYYRQGRNGETPTYRIAATHYTAGVPTPSSETMRALHPDQFTFYNGRWFPNAQAYHGSVNGQVNKDNLPKIGPIHPTGTYTPPNTDLGAKTGGSFMAPGGGFGQQDVMDAIFSRLGY